LENQPILPARGQIHWGTSAAVRRGR